MFDFQTYLCDVSRVLTPFLDGRMDIDQRGESEDTSCALVTLGHLILLGEEYLEPPVMDDIWETISLEGRLFLKALFCQACRSSVSQEGDSL